MESMLGFEEELMNVDEDDKEMLSSSNGCKLVPWLSWEEWDSVRESLFSSSANKVTSAIKRISTWRSRGCLPVVIDVTASIIEIQQRDPFYRDKDDQSADDLESEQMLAMLYCMAILRLVNCVVEKTRRKTEVSIAEAANAIGIPRKLIDVRHEGSHRDLPALQVLRDCSDKALDWLKAYYWEPQKMQIPFQGDGTAKIRRDIRSKLRELAFYLNIKQNSQLGSSLIKGKRGKCCEGLYGRNKFISIMAGKLYSSKSRGSKKKMTKCLKILVKLYSSFSSEIVSELLEFLLNAFDSSNTECPNDSQVDKSVHMSLDDWKPLIIRFSNKEPEILLSLLKAVLDMIENEAGKTYNTGGQNLTLAEYRTGTNQIEHLSYLFAWLVRLLGGLKTLGSTGSGDEVQVSSAGRNKSNAVLVELLRKCLLVAAVGGKLLVDSAMNLAKMVSNASIMEKLNKLSLIYLSHSNASEEPCFITSSQNLLIQQQEDSIRLAAEKLELIKQQKMKSEIVKTADANEGNLNRWVVAKSWNSCPIGMLPRDLGSSGRLPVLDCDDSKHVGYKQLEKKQTWALNQYSGKRKASCNIQQLDNSIAKKVKDTVEVSQSDNDVSSCEDAEGHLMIGGVWKKIGEEELQTIKSGVRILI